MTTADQICLCLTWWDPPFARRPGSAKGRVGRSTSVRSSPLPRARDISNSDARHLIPRIGRKFDCWEARTRNCANGAKTKNGARCLRSSAADQPQHLPLANRYTSKVLRHDGPKRIGMTSLGALFKCLVSPLGGGARSRSAGAESRSLRKTRPWRSSSSTPRSD